MIGQVFRLSGVLLLILGAALAEDRSPEEQLLRDLTKPGSTTKVTAEQAEALLPIVLRVFENPGGRESVGIAWSSRVITDEIWDMWGRQAGMVEATFARYYQGALGALVKEDKTPDRYFSGAVAVGQHLKNLGLERSFRLLWSLDSLEDRRLLALTLLNASWANPLVFANPTFDGRWTLGVTAEPAHRQIDQSLLRFLLEEMEDPEFAQAIAQYYAHGAYNSMHHRVTFSGYTRLSLQFYRQIVHRMPEGEHRSQLSEDVTAFTRILEMGNQWVRDNGEGIVEELLQQETSEMVRQHRQNLLRRLRSNDDDEAYFDIWMAAVVESLESIAAGAVDLTPGEAKEYLRGRISDILGPLPPLPSQAQPQRYPDIPVSIYGATKNLKDWVETPQREPDEGG